jgi:hypothetical protein
MLNVDMIEALIQRRRTVTAEFDGAVAETAPELRLVG